MEFRQRLNSEAEASAAACDTAALQVGVYTTWP